MKKLFFCALLGAIMHTHASSQNGGRNPAFEKIDSFITEFLSNFPVIPGLAIGVIDEKGSVFMKGYGWANKEAAIRVNEHTLFYTGSCTKSFTALAAALLDKEKKVLLDNFFQSYSPKFRFKNKISDSITIRQLLNHTSGLTNFALVQRLSYTGEIDQKDIIRVANEVTEVSGPVGIFDYDNFGYNIYALILKEYLKKDWKDIVGEKILKPLKMNETITHISTARMTGNNIAVPYTAFGKNGLERIRMEKQENTMHSAGGIYSSVFDLSRFIAMQINKGKLGGRQVLPSDIVQLTQTGSVKNTRTNFPFDGQGQYGLGWQINKFEGHDVVYHYGGFTGYKCHISFMPAEKIGMAIMVNEDILGAAFSDLLSAYTYACLLNVDSLEKKYASFTGIFQKRFQEKKEQTQKQNKELSGRKWQLSLPLSSYAGIYNNPYLGDLDVSIIHDSLAVKMGNLNCMATAFTSGDAIRLELIPGQGIAAYFKIDGSKNVVGVKYDGYEYERKK